MIKFQEVLRRLSEDAEKDKYYRKDTEVNAFFQEFIDKFERRLERD